MKTWLGLVLCSTLVVSGCGRHENRPHLTKQYNGMMALMYDPDGSCRLYSGVDRDIMATVDESLCIDAQQQEKKQIEKNELEELIQKNLKLPTIVLCADGDCHQMGKSEDKTIENNIIIPNGLRVAYGST